jgi:predicted unusual protein kinase regulating ubiquinone biosynthesis (AarF/ABC1/UbiB family)
MQLRLDPRRAVFRDLGRRVQYRGRGEPRVERMERLRFRPNRLRAFLRLLGWTFLVLRTVLLIAHDRVRGRRSEAHVGRRLREAFERAGGTFVKIGQQLGNRVDLLPYGVCQELARLYDRMQGIPIDEAVAAIEKASGRALHEVFAKFDPEPVGSASIACVYQAELRTGAKVAVKVRRPGIGERFAEDLLALDWLCLVAEALTLLRPGFTKMLRLDLREMLMEELDFVMEARYAELYRRQAKRDGIRFTTAPRVYPELSDNAVIVEEFVSGIFLSELLAAVEAGDEAELARLAAMGIRPKKVARRLLRANYWSGFEGLLFHADPHPANIVIRPNSELVFLDFGACGPPSERMRRINWEIMTRMGRNDVSGAARVAVSIFEPLPHVDVDYLLKRCERAWWRFIYSMRSKHSAWWERTTAGLWLTMLETTREMNLSANLDTLRAVRASLLYDTLAARLWPQMDDRPFHRYAKERYRREARRIAARWRAESPDQRAARVITRLDELGRTGADLVNQVRAFAESAPSQFMQAASKASYALFSLLALGGRLVLPVLVIAVVIAVGQLARGEAPTVLGSAAAIATHPLYIGYALLMATFTARRLQFRFSDTEPR